MESPRLSFKGYRFTEALYRNKDTVKLVLVAVTGYSYLVGFDWMPFTQSVAAGFIALAGKLVMDAFDYYFSKVEVPDSVANS